MHKMPMQFSIKYDEVDEEGIYSQFLTWSTIMVFYDLPIIVLKMNFDEILLKFQIERSSTLILWIWKANNK